MMHTARLYFIFLVAMVLLAGGEAVGQSYNLQGSARALGNDCYRLTDQVQGENGTVWYTNKIDITTSFDIEFTMNFGNSNEFGADGMVFVLQSQGSNALGQSGQGIGFQGFLPSLGIEFDTYQNTEEGDPEYDHIGVHRDGNVSHLNASSLTRPVQASQTSEDIEDGQEHRVRISWIAPRKVLEVYFDCSKRISMSLDMKSIFKTQTEVYWGFSGATGLYVNRQSVCLKNDIVSRSEVRVCEGETVELLSRPAPDDRYVWSPTTGLSDPTIRNPKVRPSASQTYVVEHRDNCGLPVRDSILVQVDALPVLDLGEDRSVCGADSLLLRPERLSAGSAARYAWSNGDTTLTTTIFASGTYALTLQSGVCTVQDTVAISLLDSPQLTNPDYIPLVCLREQPVRLTSTTTGTGLSYAWVHSGATSSSVEVDQPGRYELVVTNGAGCSTLEVFYVTDSCAANVWIPDAFTPNSDGQNDRLGLYVSETIELRFWIYNRWGAVVFYTEDQTETWDGHYQGVLCPPDAYTWKAEYRTHRNQDAPFFVKRGVAWLIR
jgi:gliding motility-associated-like protein